MKHTAKVNYHPLVRGCPNCESANAACRILLRAKRAFGESDVNRLLISNYAFILERQPVLSRPRALSFCNVQRRWPELRTARGISRRAKNNFPFLFIRKLFLIASSSTPALYSSKGIACSVSSLATTFFSGRAPRRSCLVLYFRSFHFLLIRACLLILLGDF